MALKDSQGNFIGSPLLGETAYEYDWFTGSQINLYIGDVVVDSALAVGWNGGQSKVPVFGFASQYWSFLADGQVMIQGSLTIAFKEAGYLMWPMQRFLHRAAHSASTSPRYGVNKRGQISQGTNAGDATFTTLAKQAANRRVMRANVEQMAEWNYGPQRAGSKYNKFWNELGAMSDDKFEDYAEVFEDAIWYGSDTSNPLARDKLFSKNLMLDDFIDDDTEELILSHRRADQYPPIDIWITYGDMDRQPVNHTVKKLLDVSFVGQSQTIEISGQPTYEQYHFIARNIA